MTFFTTYFIQVVAKLEICNLKSVQFQIQHKDKVMRMLEGIKESINLLEELKSII